MFILFLIYKLRVYKSIFLSLQNQNSLSEIEKREKRAMERKLSEMEEELKVFIDYFFIILNFALRTRTQHTFISIYISRFTIIRVSLHLGSP